MIEPLMGTTMAELFESLLPKPAGIGFLESDDNWLRRDGVSECYFWNEFFNAIT